VDSVVSCRNSGGGIRAENADKIKIRWGRYCNNGQYGISAGDGMGDGTLDSLLVYGVEVDSNCTQGIERGKGCGAMKISESSNFTFSRGDIHHNFGNGWWVDIDNVNSRLDSSLVRVNWGTGVICEISFGCVIAYNTIEDNGQQPKDAFQNGAGVLCVASEDCWIHHNTVQRNAHGINTLQQNRPGHIVADALVEHNVITSNRGTAGYKGAYEPTLHHTGRNNVWTCNTHNMSGSAVFVFENSQRTDAAWIGAGHDTPCGAINRN
jgi:Right handed beta helix region